MKNTLRLDSGRIIAPCPCTGPVARYDLEPEVKQFIGKKQGPGPNSRNPQTSAVYIASGRSAFGRSMNTNLEILRS